MRLDVTVKCPDSPWCQWMGVMFGSCELIGLPRIMFIHLALEDQKPKFKAWLFMKIQLCCASAIYKSLTLSLPRVLSSKLMKKYWISFCKIINNKQYHLKVLLNSFHLNGHTLGFHPQTQTLEPHLLTQGLTLGAKGLIPLLWSIFPSNIDTLSSSYM